MTMEKKKKTQQVEVSGRSDIEDGLSLSLSKSFINHQSVAEQRRTWTPAKAAIATPSPARDPQAVCSGERSIRWGATQD